MKKHYAFHITMSMMIDLSLILGAIYSYFVIEPSLILFYSIPIFIWFCRDLFKWLRILFAVKFSTPKTIITKGYRFAMRKRVYMLEKRGKLHYSSVRFSDDRLKGDYVYFDEAVFRGGEPLEVTYYPRAKYIVDIKRANTNDETTKSNPPQT